MVYGSIRKHCLVYLIPLFVMVLSGCGGHPGDRQKELQALADSNQFDEIKARIQLCREKGEKEPFLDYFEGVAFLAKDEDLPAKKAFEKAIAADSSLAVVAAQQYRKAALADWEAGWKGRATTRMRSAYLLDGLPDMGELENDVADLLFEKKEAKEVIPVFRDLLAKGGTLEDRQRWIYRMGRALEYAVSPEAGLETYRSFWREFPKDKPSGNAGMISGRQQKILLASARKHMEEEDWEAALVDLNEIFSLPPRASSRMQAYYLAGVCEEKKGRPENALRAYDQVLRYQIPGPGGERDKARQRVEALQEAGVH